MKKIFLLVLLYLFAPFARGQQKKILFIGNSYTYVNDLPGTLYQLALAGGDTILYDSNTVGGYTLQLHSTNSTTLNKIASQPWDYVVLQEQSQIPSFPPQQVDTMFYPYAIFLDSLIHANDSCTQTVFYMTWGRKYGDASNCAFYPPVCTYTGMQARLRSSYLEISDSLRAIVSPAGISFQNSMLADSNINLYQTD
ncbi:MAG: SGNH/GDSL hydrolase family protein, partial [Bacteroidetes bacterium]|nr:SGNH/GDSL hydrolase family protein [Bacteroidota bacterium]